MKNMKYNRKKGRVQRIDSKSSYKYHNNSKFYFKFTLLILFFIFILSINLSLISASADLAVNTFSCTPSEVAINNIFSCTAQIKNNGDAAGTVNTATLYPDSNNWLEQSSYAKSSGVSVSPGQTTEVTFTGLRTVKSGNNGFTRITLDSVTDTYVADNNIKVNVIDVATVVTNTQSSRTMGQTFDSSAQVTAGGNIDVTLTFTVVSGGCTIGNQDSQKTISGMQNGNQQSRSWASVTMGSGSSARNCVFTITSAATGANGIASKTDAVTSTITCTDCPSDPVSSGSSNSGSGGGGGGGGSAGFSLGNLLTEKSVELKSEAKVGFVIASGNHSLTVQNLTETTAKIKVESTPQEFLLTVGDKINVDLNSDGNADISIKLKSINIITKLANFILAPLTGAIAPTSSTSDEQPQEAEPAQPTDKEKSGISQTIKSLASNAFFISIAVVIIILVIIIVRYIRRFRMFRMNHLSNLKHYHHIK